jgi:6-phosphogluconolactonase (cycloisomerase 2 family)
LALHPDVPGIFALNDDSETIVAMAVDPSDGCIGAARSVLNCGSPVLIVFRN